MRTAILSTPKGAIGGNRSTALRWARRLRSLGWSIQRAEHAHRRPPCRRVDLIVALHAVKVRAEVERLTELHPDAKLVVACAGTDIYEQEGDAQPLLERADRLIVLQEQALKELSDGQRRRAHVIHQSMPRRSVPAREAAEIAVIASLRPVKDPLLPAEAARLLPDRSELRVIHVGAALDPQIAEAARVEQAKNPRYEWRGNVRRSEALCLLGGARAVVVPSRSEGGANVITEAFALGTPVLASKIPGNTGLLGTQHQGLFRSGDAEDLARLMLQVESTPGFAEQLSRRSKERAALVAPERESAAWLDLLGQLGLGS
ncbi:glycosyltransferase [Planctomycetota bacterium]|nr:glycosyltransferase [Planctomycetota bacterium]